MNTIDAIVIEVTGEPVQYNFSEKYWFVPVKYYDMGGEGQTEIMVGSLEQAEKICAGYKFQI